ncbi:helix-turn-helix transcriptional regulator [Methylophilus sp.]|uniref:helix-turn-helix domain-containing protein n=1 Tax=Methylophilus sp. TaxID=29541 RepID=UPI0011DBDFA1|nr:helix-turn-helix transcriptional regulator [Methylophilus sp.]TXI46435.1 MAG: XRE family transcriptional regulator [Methylophilus sp.]
MEIQKALGLAIKEIRLSKQLTQEFFSDISSRTYMSVLENGRKKPSVDKIDSLANAIGVHPLTILTLSYLIANEGLSLADLQKKVSDELSTINR